jgi:hypothetical protein
VAAADELAHRRLRVDQAIQHRKVLIQSRAELTMAEELEQLVALR